MLTIFKGYNYSELIQNLSGIGTFITALIALVTLRILVKQRKDSFKPNIIFGDRIYATCIAEKDNILKTKWTKAYSKEEEPNSEVFFSLINIGNGVAQNVKVKESFDFKRAMKFIQDLDSENEILFPIIMEQYHIRTTFDDTFIILDTEDSFRNLGTFLVNNNQPQKYIFTDICLHFLSCFEYLKTKHNLDWRLLEKFPKCKYEISFEDIEGNKYKSKYECTVFSILKGNYHFTFIKN